jgi:hypothetical protein
MSAIVAQGIRANQQLADENGEGQNRTGDTTIFSRVLYQLSYLAGAHRLASAR